MINQIDTVELLVDTFVSNAKSVIIDNEMIVKVAKYVGKWKRSCPRVFQGFPKCIGKDSPNAIRRLFLYELIANSVNYCYWYGRHNIRSNGVNSIMMYDLLDESFDELEKLKETAAFFPHDELEMIVGFFGDKLSRARFPLIDHRIRHLKEIVDRSDLLSVIEIAVQREDYSVDKWLDYLITSFPGYSKDLFLKRTFLFVMQMWRRCGIFGKEISKIPVPADYQVPKMLRWLGCIRYESILSRVVDGGYPIADGCWAECEIRAATIVACKRIADLAMCTCEEVDTYLWSKRKQCNSPFHLTITTNY